MRSSKMPKYHKRDPSGWDELATWYDGWMGMDGSDHHRKLAIPAVLDLLELRSGEQVLDLGAGQGVLAAYVTRAGGVYTGVEISPRLVALAQKRHGAEGRFIQGDARYLARIAALQPARFDAVV